MPKDQWTGPELASELRGFEAALRAVGIDESTVQTYVGRSETFVRWLTGDYVPRGPVRLPGATEQLSGIPPGYIVLDDLRTHMGREDIARYLTYFSAVGGDRAIQRLLLRTEGRVDLRQADHQVAVIEWLRGWGRCRHLRRADTRKTVDMLASWWEACEAVLPSVEATLTTLDEQDFIGVELAYDALAAAPAASRAAKDRVLDVHFGDTAAAKTLFVVRPQVFLPWDMPIRRAFGWSGGGASYAEFLRQVTSALLGLARRLNSTVDRLPQLLGRPDSPPPKIVDEFLWIRITQGL